MKNQTTPLIPPQGRAAELLVEQAAHFRALAKDQAITSLHKSPDGRSITEQDARLIRDHEIRAETFKTAAKLIG